MEQMNREVRILTGEPTIELIAEMKIDWIGVGRMARWVQEHRPGCVPVTADCDPGLLFPHTMYEEDAGRYVTDNELLVELAGRKCYDSFGLKAGKKTNKEYIAHTQQGEIPHASILYHAKMTFFIAGVSRRVSQEMMRNYVGSDRDQEGSPSQESTRFTHNYGTFVAHPRLLEQPEELEIWKQNVQRSYNEYVDYIERCFARYKAQHGEEPKGLDRKRIYESAIGRMPWDYETSYIWTTNPMALMKLFRERCDDQADLEFQRFAKRWRRVCYSRAPNLFPKLTPEIVYG